MKVSVSAIAMGLLLAGCNAATTTANPPPAATPDEIRARQMCMDSADGYKGLDSNYESYLISCQIQRLREIRLGIK